MHNCDFAKLASAPWVGAEGERNGVPILIRARRFDSDGVGVAGLVYLFVITYRYESSDGTGLPSNSQYQLIARFEEAVVDAIEVQQIGISTIIRTCAGTVRYYCYVSNVEKADLIVDAGLKEVDIVETTCKNDALWSEYHRLRQMITGL